MEYQLNLKNKIINYYINYYNNLCSLPGYVIHAENRINEESSESVRMKKLQLDWGLNFDNQKHFVVGAGTGGLCMVLSSEYNCSVFGIEPDQDALEIIKDKCAYYKINPDNFKLEFGEKISFNDDQFDFVHCFTVLEHVNDINLCIDEMIRIVKPGGSIYLNTPNYAYPYESHYKLLFPTFLPKFLGKLYLFLRRRSSKLLNSINFITEKNINKILIVKRGIIWKRLYRPQQRVVSPVSFWLNYLIFSKFIYRNQEILITKVK